MNKALTVLLLCLLLLSCGGSESEYSQTRCYLVIDNSAHQDATLASAMNAAAPGIFCKIKTSYSGGATYFSFQNNQGLSSTSKLNAIDERRTIIVGLNNSLLVGYGSLTQPAEFYAYDGECPNCFDPTAIPVKTHPLQMTASGMAVCQTCKRQYNLNSQGVVGSGEGGKKLTRYHASCTGPFGVLSVQ